MNEDNFFSKKNQRIISSFIGQGLLYDYLTNTLDPERKKSVEDFLRANPEAQMDAQKIQNALKYTEKLAQTEIAAELLEKVAVSASYGQNVMNKIRFDEWSPALKMALEGTVVALGITTLAVLIPWHKVMDLMFGSREVILAEVEKAPAEQIASDLESNTSSTKESETFPDEGTPTTTTLKTAAVTMVATVSTTTSSSTTMTMPPSPAEESERAAGVVAASEKRTGVLYRGIINVTNVKAVTPKLVEKVQELGGRKAGQVELGWFKGDSSYFHFTMPESRYQELQEFFQEYGQLTIKQEAHERVMPEGIRRIIITVYEKK
jgi:hypothetical protein